MSIVDDYWGEPERAHTCQTASPAIYDLQWNLYNPDTCGPGKSVLIMEVS